MFQVCWDADRETGGARDEGLRITHVTCLYGSIVRLSGRLDRNTAGSFRVWLTRRIPAGEPAIVINLDRLECVDLEGLSVLAAACGEWQARGVHPILVAGQAGISEEVHRCGLSDRVLTTLTEAAAFEVLDSLLGEVDREGCALASRHTERVLQVPDPARVGREV